MVVYYSYTGKTKPYAEALAAKYGLKCVELVEKKPRSKGAFGFLKGCLDGIRQKESELAVMPDISGSGELFVCAPVWAGSIAPAARYFINHAGLSGKKVNLLLTHMSPEGGEYKDKASELMQNKGAASCTIYTVNSKSDADIRNVIDRTVK